MKFILSRIHFIISTQFIYRSMMSTPRSLIKLIQIFNNFSLTRINKNTRGFLLQFCYNLPKGSIKCGKIAAILKFQKSL